jgi:hypothetical protein
MPFVHMMLVDIEAQRLQHTNATYTQYDFLFKSIRGILAI